MWQITIWIIIEDLKSVRVGILDGDADLDLKEGGTLAQKEGQGLFMGHNL